MSEVDHWKARYDKLTAENAELKQQLEEAALDKSRLQGELIERAKAIGTLEGTLEIVRYRLAAADEYGKNITEKMIYWKTQYDKRGDDG